MMSIGVSAQSMTPKKSANRSAARTTERTNPASADLDKLDAAGILAVIQKQDASVPRTVRREIPNIAKAVDAAVKGLRRGGRLIYVGAGTSGRIAMLDAAECPPTFGTPPEMVQAIIAGRSRALTHAVEGAEDDGPQARRDLASKKIGARDVVVGIAASGRTPYTVEALRYAKSRRATTVAITSNPGSLLAQIAHIAVVPQTGPEVIAGSTRMKAALAQKMVLHMISTATMTLLGNVYRNYMVGVRPTNEKLWQRACSMIEEITGAEPRAAEQALRTSRKNVKVAVAMLHGGMDRRSAEKLLTRHKGDLRKVMK
jgi:N-acetylmuramic acid 6-phosphate etherase